MTEAPRRKPIALALSGGGVRAMVFHLGVLRQLAERGWLERVARVSSVSGGSLVTGLILQAAQLRWPTSQEFLAETYPALRQQLCARSMQRDAARQLLWPGHWRFVLSRANLLAAALRQQWKVAGRLSDLPVVPEWSINGTNAENGRRFRFKRDSIGDYQTGYAAPGVFPLADALAVSAAFPGGFGPLRLQARDFHWFKRAWDAPAGSEEATDPRYPVLHLYDGGVYDNMGLESFFDAGRCQSKHPEHFILVSDAGMPLPTGFSFGALNPFRLKRVADIMSDQSHALRIRTFHHYLQQQPGCGAFLYIANAARTGGDQERQFSSRFPTTLRRLRTSEFDQIALHGYRLAESDIADDQGEAPGS